MCGICGIVSRTPITETTPIRLMQDALYHRGPDSAGEYSDTHVALAMRRLKIIDLEGGSQPLYNEDRSLVLIANGEIYNFIELRAQLQAQSHHFRTGSDCETIIHLYEDYGLDCVHHLRGMFAFALWDSKKRRLILARDRMGEKPLYLYERYGQLTFASEMKALLNSGLVPFELDPVSIDLYFHYQYVPEPATPVKNVRKLPAAHTLLLDVNDWHIKENCYWRMEDAPPIDGNPAELIRAELEKVSELVIRSDVQVGVALSGGLDSSAIAALAAKNYPGTMHAFSVGYSDRPPCDERKDARALAEYLKIPFHDIELTTQDMVRFFPKLVYWSDDPIADISSYGYYAVMKLARKHNVPVVLQGQGGDELFWGYPWLRQAARQSLQKASLFNKGWRALPSYIHLDQPRSLRPRHLRSWAANGFGLWSGLKRLQHHRNSPARQMVFYDLTPDFRMARVGTQTLYTPEFIDRLNAFRAEALFTFPQPWPQVDIRITCLICETYLMENGIAQGDRLSMASSVELRLPLVDYRLVETVIGLRKTQKDHNLPPKAWLKAALKGILPDWALTRPKRGFEPPVRSWHRALFAAHGKMLDNGYVVQAGILKPEVARYLAAGPFPEGVVTPLSFKALVLELWCRRFSCMPESE